MARYVTLGNFSCNLCRNKIARQVAGKIIYLIRFKTQLFCSNDFTVGYSFYLLMHDTNSVLGNSMPYRQKKKNFVIGRANKPIQRILVT